MRPAALTIAATATLALSGLALAAGGGPAEQGQALFKQDCSSCHSIGGGDGVGPDLKTIVASSGESAVRDFIADPTKVIASGDPKIAALVTKFHGVKMPNMGLGSAQVDALLAYLKAQGGGATTPATKPTPAPAAGGTAAGENLYTGATRFTHGGPACISCHTIAGTGNLGGGQLGPDLTRAATKYGAAKGLASVLSSIPFPKMVPLYKSHPLTASEQADLAAFLAAPRTATSASDEGWKIAVLAICVAAAALALMLVVWPRHRLVVRKRIAPTSTVRRT